MTQFAKETLPISLEEEMRRSYLELQAPCRLRLTQSLDSFSFVAVLPQNNRFKPSRKITNVLSIFEKFHSGLA